MNDVLKTYQEAPTQLHRCRDCFFDLQASSFQAIARCPMWGKDRSNAALECSVFQPRLEPVTGDGT